ncbi:hypothetical protein F2Q68_00019160 [Brassica cretica]|uniref:Uncharacterized protein n=1 Tax=Brassica cretica TaxID=69181 RepID=A0A8S9G2K1_BRACR|nr:hypothetical protein F2Q68_00019160 [Brassica cretica]
MAQLKEPYEGNRVFPPSNIYRKIRDKLVTTRPAHSEPDSRPCRTSTLTPHMSCGNIVKGTVNRIPSEQDGLSQNYWNNLRTVPQVKRRTPTPNLLPPASRSSDSSRPKIIGIFLKLR